MGKNLFEKEFINCLHGGCYNQAKELAKDTAFEELYDILLKISFQTGSLLPYSFFTFMLLDKETAQIHHAASVIISTALSHYDGAFSIGLLHARRAYFLEPYIIMHQEWLLFFYNIPEQVMDDYEAKKIAENILTKDSTNRIALDVIKKLRKNQVPLR
jgi:hypothetical protein